MRNCETQFAPVEYTNTPRNVDIGQIRDEVLRQVDMGNEVSVLMLKPSDIASVGINISGMLDALICESRVQVLCIAEKQLRPEHVLELYSPMFEGAEWVEGTRDQLINYMTSGPIRSYLLAGPNANEVAAGIKGYVRSTFLPLGLAKSVKNLVHSPEYHEIEMNIAVLFDQGVDYENFSTQ